jgi:hypothetical protein
MWGTNGLYSNSAIESRTHQMHMIFQGQYLVNLISGAEGLRDDLGATGGAEAVHIHCFVKSGSKESAFVREEDTDLRDIFGAEGRDAP